MLFEHFAQWVHGMDAMVDVFAATAERRFAMITRSAVALRLGVPLIHAVDSEISDIVRHHNAGWVLDPDDIDGWGRVCDEIRNPAIVEAKQRGAADASARRFAPEASLERAASSLAKAVPLP